MPNLLLIGPTNNGKSMIIEKFRRTYLSDAANPSPPEEIPIVIVQMPSDPKIARFYTMLLHTMNVRLISRSRISDLETKVLQALEKLKVRLLIIDEVHNLLAGTSSAQREFLNLIRFLGNQLKIPIVCVGTKDAYYAVRSDDQLENRFEPFTLPLWQDDEEFGSLLASITSTLPLRKTSTLANPDMIRFILDKSEGTIGEIMTLLTKAAVLAIESGEEMINKKILAKIDYQSPTERRRTFERAFG
jgi:type II secretory pathway predicted ATPase ExeA